MKIYRLYISVFTIVLMGLCLPLVMAQTTAKGKAKNKEDKYQIHPTLLKTSPTGIYIPRDLPDTFTELDKMLSPALRAEMHDRAESDMIQYHRGLGMWIRNNWGLWKGLRLAKWFNQQQIVVPDDMSGIIFTSYWRYLHHQPIALEDQVKTTLAYWERAKIAAAEEKKAGSYRDSDATWDDDESASRGGSEADSSFPPKPLDDVRVRYMASFAGGILLTAKIFDAKNITDDRFSTQTYFLNLTTMALHPVRLPEMDVPKTL